MKIKQLAILLLLTTIYSCKKTETEPLKPYDAGVIVVNAGNFTDNNGSLSLLQKNSNTINLDIFQKENLRSLAGGLSGYAEVGDKGVILVDNSTAGKDLIEIVNARTFKSIATIAPGEIENPRNVIKVSATKAYISAWDATGDFSNFFKNQGYIAVLDLVTNKITKKIPVQNGAETMTVIGNEVYVGNATYDKTSITVIDTNTDTPKTNMVVGSNPTIIGMDINNKLWLFADNELIRINPTAKTIETKVKINSTNFEKTASNFVMSSDKKSILYTFSFYDSADNYSQKGETYRFEITETVAKTEKPFINKLFGGGMAIDPTDGTIYAGLVPSFKQAGYVFRYKSNGALVDSVKAEIAPSKFFFK